MSLQGLALHLLKGVQLHEALGQLGPLRGAGGDANEHAPLQVSRGAVADDLCACQVGRALKHLDRRCIWRALDAPVVHSACRHQAQHVRVDPLPVLDGLRHLVRLQLGLGVQVKYLQIVASCAGCDSLESDDLLVDAHQCAVCANLAAGGRHGVGHVNDDHCVARLALLSHSHIALALCCNCPEVDVCWVDTQRGQLQLLIHSDGGCSHPGGCWARTKPTPLAEVWECSLPTPSCYDQTWKEG
mmetsp:Transcript_18521/g.52005  ORF Transcript_18521/g.52005 Transcript_18521/m.52005 type:complete len:243 (-) Transcript_18521:3-731(-)